MYEHEVLETFRFCGIKTFPVSCRTIAEGIGYKLETYQEKAQTKEQLMEMLKISNDAFVDGPSKVIYYNYNTRSIRRIRFSIAHELGHIIMFQPNDEDVADCFASTLLVPKPIVYAERLHTSDEIAKYFYVSSAVANRVITSMNNPNEYLDSSGLKMIERFDLRHKCIGIFPMYPVKDEPSTVRTLITNLKSQSKQKEDKERYRKQVRSLQGKIKRARLRMMEATDEVTYRKYQKKVWECEKHLALIQGKRPFDEDYQMEDLEKSILEKI